MTDVRLQSVLLDADGPLVVVFRDAVESIWLGTCVDRSIDGDEYLCIPVSPSRLSQFRHGDIDLRIAFTEPQIDTPGRVFIPAKSKGVQLRISPIQVIPDDWLPDAGFFLTAFMQPVAAEYREITAEATAQNRPIVHLNLNPPKATDPHAIDADLLGEALLLFQKSLRYAHSAANKLLSVAEKKLLSAVESYKFEAFATAPSSFEVHLQAKKQGDAFGYTPHVRALRKLDEIAAVIDDTNAALAVAVANRGHFVSAITALMEFVSKTDIPLSYAWTAPSQDVVHHTIRPEPALALYQQLVAKVELTRQEISFEGVFHAASENSGRWNFETVDGDEHNGDVVPGAAFTLRGVVIGSVTYTINCLEVLVEAQGSGRESTKLLLTAYPKEIRPESSNQPPTIFD